MFFGSNDVIYSNSEDIINQLRPKILLSEHPNEFIERINFLTGKVGTLEHLIMNDENVSDLNSHTKRISAAAKSKGFVSLLVFDLGGQERFWSFYDVYFSKTDNVLFFRDFENTILSEVELQSLRGLYEKVLLDNARAKKGCFNHDENSILNELSLSYALSKSDVGYLNNEFSIDLSPDAVASFERHNLVMPVTSLYSWGNRGVMACINSLLLKVLMDGKYAYNICLAGSGAAGKTSFVNTLLNLLTNNNSINDLLDKVVNSLSDTEVNHFYETDYRDLSNDELIKLKNLKEQFSSGITSLTVGPNGVPLAITPEIFYYHDENFRSCFVNNNGEIVYYLKPEYDSRLGNIKTFKVFNADTSEFVFNDSEGNPLSEIQGQYYGHIIKWFYDEGLAPVYDLDNLSMIAQFMKPSAWGLQSSYDGFFPDDPNYLKTNRPNLLNCEGLNKKYKTEVFIRSGSSLKEINEELKKRGIN